MTKLDLITAIGAAGDEDLEHSERLVSGKHRIKTRVLMAAAIIALLSFTAFAAPRIWNALFGVTANQYSVSRIFVEKGQPADVRESSLDISLDVQMSKDAPSRLITCYVPMLPAEQMEPIPLTVMKGAVINFRTDSLLQWKNEDGEYVLFRQVAWPDYAKGQTFDTVSSGFDADYSITQAELGGYTVQRLVVEPSEKDENGVHAEHPGLQKLYWSDGFYLFSMEVNYSMEGRNSWIKKDWETLNQSYEKTERDVNGTAVLCYESNWAAQLLWQFDGADYTICSVGPERFPVEDLLRIMDVLIAVEDVDSVLME